VQNSGAFLWFDNGKSDGENGKIPGRMAGSGSVRDWFVGDCENHAASIFLGIALMFSPEKPWLHRIAMCLT